MTMDTEIKRLRDQWARKLTELVYERRNIDKQINALQQMLKGAAALTEDPIPKEYTLGPMPLPPGLDEMRSLGLTDAIRLIFEKRPDGAMTAIDIRDFLKMCEYPLTQSNQMIAVHQALARLVKKGEIRKLNGEGRTRYQWLSNVERALAMDGPGNLLYTSGIGPETIGSNWYFGLSSESGNKTEHKTEAKAKKTTWIGRATKK